MDIVEFFEFIDEQDRIDAVDQIVDNDNRFINRSNPFETYNDSNFRLRYRFDKETVHDLIGILYDRLKRITRRNNSVSVDIQVSKQDNFKCVYYDPKL